MQVLRETCSMRDWVVLGMEVMPDHVHLFLSVPPRWSPSDVAKILKGVSARRILKEFPRLRRGRGGGHLWTPSFYVGSAGNISAQAIQRYIESQRKYQDDDA
jgi:putative transposase